MKENTTTAFVVRDTNAKTIKSCLKKTPKTFQKESFCSNGNTIHSTNIEIEKGTIVEGKQAEHTLKNKETTLRSFSSMTSTYLTLTLCCNNAGSEPF